MDFSYMNLSVENYAIKLFSDQIDTLQTDMFVSNISKTLSEN